MKLPNEIPEFLFSVRLTPKKSLVAVAVASLMTFLTVRCGINQDDFLRIYNEIRKGIKFDLPDVDNIINEFDNQLNERILKDPKLLEFKVKNEVTDAIDRYERETGDDGRVRLPSPRFSETPLDASVCRSVECRALGGEMRLCAPWMPDCPPEDNSKTATEDLTNQEESGIINKSVRNEPTAPGKFKF